MTALQQPPHDRPRSRSIIILLAFLAIGGFFLITEHAAPELTEKREES